MPMGIITGQADSSHYNRDVQTPAKLLPDQQVTHGLHGNLSLRKN